MEKTGSVSSPFGGLGRTPDTEASCGPNTGRSENIALAAASLALGVCFVRSANEAALREVLELPDSLRPDILVAVGHPASTPSPGVKAPAPIAYRDRFGTPWEPSP
jgi:nitroreductase